MDKDVDGIRIMDRDSRDEIEIEIKSDLINDEQELVCDMSSPSPSPPPSPSPSIYIH